MAMQFSLSTAAQVFSMEPGESFNLVTLSNKHVYRIQNYGPATIRLDWDAPPGVPPLSLEAGRAIDLEVARLDVAIPSTPLSGPYAVGCYWLLG
jgi:hypothetical protein